MVPESQEAPLRVLVAGGGVAGLEALLAMRDMAADRVELTLLSPDADFVYRPLAVAEPFSMGHVHRYPLRRFADDLGVRLVRGSLERVDPHERLVATADGDPLGFEALLVATGAGAEPAVERALTWWPEGDPEAFGGLLRDIEEGYSKRIAFVVPPRVAWALPAYELALMTARQVRSMGADGVELTLITPEDGPLAIFGSQATQAVAEELDAAGVRVITGAYVEAAEPGHIELQPGARRLEVERVVALPRPVGPRVAGVPADAEGFIPIDGHARVIGVERVWAAGDGANFPIKQGGLAAQQAYAAASDIAALAGAAIDPEPFRPVLRGLLMTGDKSRFMSSDVAGGGGEGQAAEYRLWWPPVKIAGRYLAPYLAARDPDLAVEPTAGGVPGGVEVHAEVGAYADAAGGQ
ncbi:MAG: NAD(P)/FAD-dependent oxidoreductase [Solirubrobacteraceae bacterium]